jgi:hypothetical protein
MLRYTHIVSLVITETECVYCAVRTGSLNIIQVSVSLLTQAILVTEYLAYFTAAIYVLVQHCRLRVCVLVRACVRA